jgi:uncharacterized membrane protein
MESQTVKDGKTIAIISYITFIGTIVAFVMNQNKKNTFAAFHIRQAIGIVLLSFLIGYLNRFIHISGLNWLLNAGVFVLFILGIVSAAQGEEKPIPLLGEQFQQWFRNFG